MMKLMEELSLGLITYKGSKYLDRNYEHKEFNHLTKVLEISATRVVIIDEDKYSPGEININFINILKELNFFLKNLIIIQIKILQKSRFRSWSRPTFNIILGILSIIKILWNFIKSKLSKQNLESLQRFIARQKNITNNHKEMIKKLTNSPSPYILILEDDFFTKDLESIRTILQSIFEEVEFLENIKIINLSQSFTENQLGIDKNKTQTLSLTTSKIHKINNYNYPVTNTACAILYKKEICLDLLDELNKLDRYQFIPIDHKLNISLRNLLKNKKLSNLCYASITPGLFIQRSLHA